MPAAMVLAAGLGTRLRPLTDHCAKPLVPVGDRPMLAHVLERLRAASLGPVVVNAHHRLADIRDFADRETDIRLCVSEEPELLGTAGGVRRAAHLLGEGDVLVWNGDVLAEPDLPALLASHAKSGAAATLVVRPMPRGQGTIGIGVGDRIVRVRRTRVGREADEAHGGEFIGVHVLGELLRTALPQTGCLAGDVYVPALREGARLRAFRYGGPFFDIGTLPQYLAANLAWLGARGAAQWVGRGVRLEPGVALDRSIVGDGASAGGAGSLTRCVVWPGAVATAPLADAVISRQEVIGAFA